MEYIWDFFLFPASIYNEESKTVFATFHPLNNSFYTPANIRAFFTNPEFCQNIRFLECSDALHCSSHILIMILKKYDRLQPIYNGSNRSIFNKLNQTLKKRILL